MIPSSHSQMTGGVYGAHSPKRQPLPRITRPVTALLPAAPAVELDDLAQTMPALPATVVPVLTPPAAQSVLWRERAVALAWETGWQCQASYSGHSARGNGHGSEVYAVPSSQMSSQRGHLTYRVTFTPDAQAVTIHDGRYECECIAALHGKPCRHAGAALLLAQARAETRESIEAARAERMSWAWATHHGGSAEGLQFFQVGRGVGRQWERLRVVWDTTRDVAIWCDCGAHVCPHIGAVALRVAKERADALWRAQHNPDPDWMNALEPLWDGSTLPMAFV